MSKFTYYKDTGLLTSHSPQCDRCIERIGDTPEHILEALPEMHDCESEGCDGKATRGYHLITEDDEPDFADPVYPKDWDDAE